MSLIERVLAREILDSRGFPTVEVDVVAVDGSVGRAGVPSGASTGHAEALELRDEEPDRYVGKGVCRAVEHVNQELAGAVVGLPVTEQAHIDTVLLEIDGTDNKAHMGANAMLGVSLAAAKCGAESVGLPLFRYLGGADARTLPVPLLNVINGGAHADNSLDIQEFMLVPAGLSSFSEALRAGAECFQALKDLLGDQQLSTSVGDEGGFAPAVETARETLDLLMGSIDAAGYRPGEEVFLALDVAATELSTDGGPPYSLPAEELANARTDHLVALYDELCTGYPLLSIEDGLGDEDWSGWQQLTSELGERVQLVGDDLFVTNVERIERGIREGIANAVLIKPNQIGTLTETMAAVRMARDNGYAVMLSHRSGETTDSTIADLAVATECGQIKAGSTSRGERIAKYNQLLRIEQTLEDSALYAGRVAFNGLLDG